MKKILITESKGYSKKAITTLERAGYKVECGKYTYEKLKGKSFDHEGIIVRLGITIDRQVMDSFKRLRFIASPTTGTDHIDLAYAKRKGVKVITLKGERAFLDTITPTAELVIGLMLDVMRNISASQDAVKCGEWDRDRFVGCEAKGKRLAIIGLGRLGTMVARIAKAMQMQVVYFDPHVENEEYKRCKTLEEAVKNSDVVSLHVHLDESTEGLVDKKLLEKFKKGSYLINTSRGGIIDEDALLAALEDGRLAGAALDVLADELNNTKTITGALVGYARTHDNLIITPHIGGASKDSMRATEEFIAKKIVSLMRDARGAKATTP